jgi:hypothetical protein
MIEKQGQSGMKWLADRTPEVRLRECMGMCEAICLEQLAEITGLDQATVARELAEMVEHNVAEVLRPVTYNSHAERRAVVRREHYRLLRDKDHTSHNGARSSAGIHVAAAGAWD